MSVEKYLKDLDKIMETANESTHNLAGVDLRHELLNHPKVLDLLYPGSTTTLTPRLPLLPSHPSMTGHPHHFALGFALGCLSATMIGVMGLLLSSTIRRGGDCDVCCSCRRGACARHDRWRRVKAALWRSLLRKKWSCSCACHKAIVAPAEAAEDLTPSPTSDLSASPIIDVLQQPSDGPPNKDVVIDEVIVDGNVEEEEVLIDDYIYLRKPLVRPKQDH